MNVVLLARTIPGFDLYTAVHVVVTGAGSGICRGAIGVRLVHTALVRSQIRATRFISL